MKPDNSHNHSQSKISFGSQTNETSYKHRSAINAITAVKFEWYFKLPWVLLLIAAYF